MSGHEELDPRLLDAPPPADLQSSNCGILSVVVWPPYIGLSQGDPGGDIGGHAQHEPFLDIDYKRGMIAWRTQADGTIVGSAQVFVPKGLYTHFVFFSGPQEEALMGSTQLEHPLMFDRAGAVDIDPISNQDVLPRQ